ncbi:MAG: hypothetical protein JKY65_02170, partial [Planctomycetes bacterium]|nr:hypothetical protein [Planctomycetota bacterium]
DAPPADAPAADAPPADAPAADAPAADAPAVDPAAWARTPRPNGAWEHLAQWYKRQPIFATLLIVTVLGSPWFVTRGWDAYQRSTLSAGLDAWQLELEKVGLPLPFADLKAPPTPVDLTQDEGRYARSGLRSRFRALKTWSALLAGDELPEISKDPDPLEAALAACRFLRKAAASDPPDGEALERAATYLKAAPGELGEALELNHAFLIGEERRVAVQVDAMLVRRPKLITPGLEGLRTILYQRQVQRVLRQAPPSRASLEQLLPLAGRPELGVSKLLAAEGAGLAKVLSPGGGDLQRAHVLLDILRATSVNAPLDGLGEARQPVLAAFDRVLTRHMTQVEVSQDKEVRRLCLRLILVAPEADLPSFGAFASWRTQLKLIVDNPKQLVGLARRCLEVGRLPVGLEELLVSHYIGRGHAAPSETRTPGDLLLRTLLATLDPDGDEAPDPKGGPVGFEAWRGELLERIAGRKDPIAQRQRALAAFAVGQARLRAGKGEQALKAFRIAIDAGYTPRERALAGLVAASRHSEPEQALEAAQARVGALEIHARRISKMTAELKLRFELEGWAVHPRVIDPRRVSAHLDVVELSPDKPARKAVNKALKLRPHSGRANYLSAKLYAKEGDKEAARQAALRGVRGVLPDEVELRDALRALLKELGPS